MLYFFFFFFKQKTAYEMVMSDWSSDVCSSDLAVGADQPDTRAERDDQVEIADEPPATTGSAEPARDQEPAGPALRRGEVDPGRRRRAARANVLQLVDEALGLLDAALRFRGARLGAAAEPRDLAPHG